MSGELLDELEEVASFNVESILFGDVTDARPAIMSGGKEVLNAVNVGLLVLSSLLGSIVTFLVSCIISKCTFFGFLLAF